MKTFEFNNEAITIEKTGYGQYVLSGLGISVHCTDSEIWDWCDDDETKISIWRPKSLRTDCL